MNSKSENIQLFFIVIMIFVSVAFWVNGPKSVLVGSALFALPMLWFFSLALKQVDSHKRREQNFLSSIRQRSITLSASPDTIRFLEGNLPPEIIEHRTKNDITLIVCLHTALGDHDVRRKKERH